MRFHLAMLIAALLVVGLQRHAGTDASLDYRAEIPAADAAGFNGSLPNGSTLRALEECPLATTANVSCADLVVPERRDTPGSRFITVRVAILHAPDKDRRQPDPFVFLMGGQGQGFSVLEQLVQLPGLLNRDVITIEQRGTQLADPFFGCPNVENRLDDLDRNLVSQPSGEDPQQIRACQSEIESSDMDKNGYDTAASADDLWDLNQLMGIGEWNIFGVSYGGRTAQSFLRKHPDSARSLVLDSSQVTGIPFIFGYGRLNKIEVFFRNCAAAPGCSQFLDLKGAFERTMGRLLAHPIPVIAAGRIQKLTAREYMRIVTWVLYTRPETQVRELPAAILAADRRQDYAHLLSLDDRYADVNSRPPWNPDGYPKELGFHIAQQTGVLCAEEYPPLKWSNNVSMPPFPDGWTPSVRMAQEIEQQMQAEVCRRWNFTPSEPEQGQLPPTNSVPTLIVHGDHDTIAPSEDGDLLARSYPNSYRLVFPWTGHSIVERRQACFLPLLKRFIGSPTAAIDDECAKQIPEPAWLESSPETNQPDTHMGILRNLLENHVQDFSFPGVSVHVHLQNANISGTAAAGLADPNSGRQLTGREPTRMASMTKTFTAAVILRLMEQENLLLGGGIGQYLTRETSELLRSRGYMPQKITVQHLLHHTSGLPDFNNDEYKEEVLQSPQRQWSRREQIRWATERSDPTGAPGEVFSYSDTGYNLLGEIIEQVSGLRQPQAYRDLLRLDRLDLNRTWFESLETAPEDTPERAHQFYGDVDITVFNPTFDLFGGGGLVSTVRDEATFLHALMTGQIFADPTTLTTMLDIPGTNLDVSGREFTGYAMGIRSFVVEDQLCWGHDGFWGTTFAHCPYVGVTVASDRLQAVAPSANYEPLEILRTALRINRLLIHPSALVQELTV